MNSPTNTPMKRDNTVSLVINAKAIATRGGSIVRIPNLTALSSPAGHWSINQDKAKSNIKVTAQLKNPFSIYQGTSWMDSDFGSGTFQKGFVFGVNVGF